jgi:hypothetical protein
MSRFTPIKYRIFKILLAMSILGVGLAPGLSNAASHREAPLIANDPTADITDFFMFRSYEPGHEDNLILIMDVIPGEEPSSGPNYYNFDPKVVYSINIDNDADGNADDLVFEFRFKTELRGIIRDAGLFLSYVALPPISALDGPGSEGLGLRQKYSVTLIKDGKRLGMANDLIAVPSNVGPRTMPDYDALAAQGVYTFTREGQTGKVFAGQRDDPFYIDLGGVFDTLNLRRTPLPLLDPAEDADDSSNPFGVDMLSGFNVHTIALEVPISALTKDNMGPDDTAYPKLGAYASTSRKQVTVLRDRADEPTTDSAAADDLVHRSGSGTTNRWVQVQRLANPLVNEAIIGTVDKDRWNAKDPSKERPFLDYYLNPRLALALELVYGVPAEKSDRTDLVNLLLKYMPDQNKLSELLRIDVSVPPTAFADQKRLGPLAHDAAGNSTPDPAAWPNGRRPIDDVTDVAVRVIGGPNYINALAGDGVNVNDKPLSDTFPFLATPWDGVNRVHQNP